MFLALHVWSNDSVTGLCSGFSGINPERLIMCDQHRLDNAKLRKVLPHWAMLSRSGPIWYATSFHLFKSISTQIFPDTMSSPLPAPRHLQATWNLLPLVRTEQFHQSAPCRWWHAHVLGFFLLQSRRKRVSHLTLLYTSTVRYNAFLESVPLHFRSRVFVVDYW